MKTVLLAEDHALVRRGIRTMLEVEADMRVVGECGDGREAVRLFNRLRPDLVLMDVAMPDLNGIEAVRQMVASHPGSRIIMLSMHADGQYVVESLRAGASAYVLKDAAFGELLSAIKAVRDGNRYLSPPLNESMLTDYVRATRGERGVTEVDVLSNREREVLQLIGEGNTSAEIAGKLEISVRTVETHRQHIMEKLNIHSVAGLTKFAIRHGLCSL
ncbi:MAG: response regulator [Phycisphaerae bacterium]